MIIKHFPCDFLVVHTSYDLKLQTLSMDDM